MCCTNNDRQLSPSLRQQREPCYARSSPGFASTVESGKTTSITFHSNLRFQVPVAAKSSQLAVEVVRELKAEVCVSVVLFLVINDLFMDVYIDWLLF